MFDSIWSAIARKLGTDQPLQQLSSTHLDQIAYNGAAQASIAVIVSLGILFVVRKRSKKAALPKKTALRLIALEQGRMSPSSAMEVLRQAVRCYYPRAYVDSLSGDAWFKFLDSQTKQPLFHEHMSEWTHAMQPSSSSRASTGEDKVQLVRHCEQWLEQALPPTRKQRKALPKHSR